MMKSLFLALAALIAAPSAAVAQAGPAAEAVRVGQSMPRWDLLRPGTARYLRYMARADGRRVALDIWTRTRTIEPGPDGTPRLHIVQTWNGAALPMERRVESWFETQTFRPLSHLTRAERGGQRVTAAFLFAPDRVYGDPEVEGNSQAALDVATPEPVFNFETDMEMLTVLPWRAGYAARIPFYHPGGEPPRSYVYAVTGSEPVVVGARAIDCWVVAIDYGAEGDARFWIDKESQAVVRVATRGPDIDGTLFKILLPDE